jgi:hypothetical protein
MTEYSSSAIAFLGPSLRHGIAREIWNIRYFPPVRRGELLEIVTSERPSLVLIVDGYFLNSRAVLHREIMQIMRSGVRVYGAASIGALRACELRTEGMIGLGTIYEWYCAGKIDGDDEVAVLHSPDPPFDPLVIPSVTIRYSVQKAAAEGVISQNAGTALVKAAKSLYYGERSLEAILERAAGFEVDHKEISRFRSFFEHNEGRVNLKSMDASLALRILRGAGHGDGADWKCTE